MESLDLPITLESDVVFQGDILRELGGLVAATTSSFSYHPLPAVERTRCARLAFTHQESDSERLWSLGRATRPLMSIRMLVTTLADREPCV